jgi:hypothetical protein
MLTTRIALISLSQEVSLSQLHHVAAALQIQATRDVAPVWSVQATVAAFEAGQLPAGFWPVVVTDRFQTPGHGLHISQRDGSPMAFVRPSASWSLTASHEMIEMIVDPWGRRTEPGRSWEDGQGQVDYLVEACDPCQGGDFAYTIDGVLVSDFVTPHFYDPFQTAGARYSQRGHVQAPRTILKKGYLSWRVPSTGDIWQRKWDGDQPFNKRLGHAEFTSVLSMRAWIDEQTPLDELVDGLDPNAEPLSYAARWFEDAAETARVRGARLLEEIAYLSKRG